MSEIWRDLVNTTVSFQREKETPNTTTDPRITATAGRKLRAVEDLEVLPELPVPDPVLVAPPVPVVVTPTCVAVAPTPSVVTALLSASSAVTTYEYEL
jgi:hypothetical protein